MNTPAQPADARPIHPIDRESDAFGVKPRTRRDLADAATRFTVLVLTALSLHLHIPSSHANPPEDNPNAGPAPAPELQTDPALPPTPESEPPASTPLGPAPELPPEPPPIAPLTPEDRRILAELARELPRHGNAPLSPPAADAPDTAWLALANQIALVFNPRRVTKRAREAFIATTRPLGPAIRALVPTHRRYRLLQEALKRAVALFPVDAPPIPDTPYRLRVGRSAPEIALVRGRLLRDGYGDPNVQGKLLHFFDDRLKRALQRWQRDHGLPYTSVIDQHTRRALNEDRPHPVASIMLALERWRDLELRHDNDRTIIVHINEFKLFAEHHGEAQLTMPVVVGKATDKDATPATSAPLEAVIANPRWVVPARIAEETLRPSAGNDPAKLMERGFEVDVLADGRWRVRMGPGPENPLGRVKFTLVGTSGVYLHDTPVRGSFQKNDRSLSHGCVRVSDALALARWALPEQVESLDFSLTQGGRSQAFKTAAPMVVHLSYQTLSADESFQLKRHADIYQQDVPLIAAINPLPVIKALEKVSTAYRPAAVPFAPPAAPP